MMSLEGIREKANSGEYDSKLPYGEGKTKEEKLACLKACREDENRLHNEFIKDCKEAVEDYLGKITDGQFNAMFGYAWAEGHSSGYNDIIGILDEITDIVILFIKK